MSRLVTVRSLLLWLGLTGLAAAQDLPPLEPPALEPPRAEAPQPSQPGTTSQPPAPKPASRPENRPMLAIPGVTAPSSRPRTVYRPPVLAPSDAGASLSADALPLPLESEPARPAAASPRPRPGVAQADGHAGRVDPADHRAARRRARAAPRPGRPICEPSPRDRPPDRRRAFECDAAGRRSDRAAAVSSPPAGALRPTVPASPAAAPARPARRAPGRRQVQKPPRSRRRLRPRRRRTSPDRATGPRGARRPDPLGRRQGRRPQRDDLRAAQPVLAPPFGPPFDRDPVRPARIPHPHRSRRVSLLTPRPEGATRLLTPRDALPIWTDVDHAR